MTALNRIAVLTACTLALVFAMTAAPALAKEPVPDNPADAARKYCAGAYKRYCSKIPAEGIDCRSGVYRWAFWGYLQFCHNINVAKLF
jgi:hypothetical protein